MLELEAKVINIANRIRSGEPVEDSRIECKSGWPEPKKAARQIAGHANHASPESVLWVIGLNENTCTITGADNLEFSNWWSEVSSLFDGIPPSCKNYVVPIDTKTVTAILFETDRAPFLTKNPAYGKMDGGPVQWEVPWREGNSTRTARRGDLILMLSPISKYPEIEIRTATFSAEEANDRKTAQFYAVLYMVPKSNAPIVFPFHRCALRVEVEGLIPYENLSVYVFDPSGARDSNIYRNRATPNEFTLIEPGEIRLLASSPIDVLPQNYGNTAKGFLKLSAAGTRHTLTIPIAMNNCNGEGCSFSYIP